MSKLKRILCAILSMCIISVPVTYSVASVGAEDVSSLQQQLKDLEEQNKKYQDILDKTQSDIKEKEQYNDALVKKIEVLDDKIALTKESITDLNDSISEKQADIDKANEDIQSQMDALCARLRTIYMAGDASNIDIILGAKDFSDFIDKMQLVKVLSNYDKNLIDGINEKLDKITEQKKSLETDKTDLETQQASLESDQNELNTLLEENKNTLANLYATSKDTEDAMEHADLESEEIENKIKEYYEKQAAEAAKKAAEQQKKQQAQSSNQSSGNSNTSSGSNSGSGSGSAITPLPSGFTWPCPGYYYLSSVFGEDRGSYGHGAIDIAGGGIMGATVVAADSGTVIGVNNSCPHNWGKNGSCGCGGGYGNYVMIDHGNGKMTIYGHLTNATVSYGQSVSKGQTIGYVGSTGESTGAHLHFECRLNGVKYDPMSEF